MLNAVKFADNGHSEPESFRNKNYMSSL